MSEPFQIRRKAGPLRNGNELGHGSIWHAVPGEANPFGICESAALCGAAPAIQWSSWIPEGQRVTCKKCLRLIGER